MAKTFTGQVCEKHEKMFWEGTLGQSKTRHELYHEFGHGQIQPSKFQGFLEEPVKLPITNLAMAKFNETIIK